MRVGLLETIKFSETFFPQSQADTFTAESAGADLITTCAGGRNVKVGRYMAETGVSAEEAEKKLLNGQSSQGIVTAKEVHELLTYVNKLKNSHYLKLRIKLLLVLNQLKIYQTC